MLKQICNVHSSQWHRALYCCYGNQAGSNHWLPAWMILSALIEAVAKCRASKPERPRIFAKRRRFTLSGTLPKRAASDALSGQEYLLQDCSSVCCVGRFSVWISHVLQTGLWLFPRLNIDFFSIIQHLKARMSSWGSNKNSPDCIMSNLPASYMILNITSLDCLQ